eukprot:CAMPEP_0194369628 /NCGR_PEP_ID=MMETSP0174-20130528/17949_1 /TAXON_ID=216777 /ORGANISM="Proboscia alata, Strain PI-D3" /LENGTH=364 /DNA_ID=CAMNT_0039146681 /DNA_START=164 /DNA_END=1258 /DNA_ORIENTATION=-
MNQSTDDRPPPPNPVLTAYQGFVSDTPLVTRYSFSTIVMSYFASFFVDPSFALSNIPYFTIFRFELYRLVLSPLLCTSLLSLVFAYLSFVENGKRLEYSMGSVQFLVLLVTVGLSVNVAFCIISAALYFATGSQGYLIAGSESIWIVLLGLIAIECSKAPQDTVRKLFIFNVPVRYYPLAILALFSLLSGYKMSYGLSVAVGYAYGFDKLNFLKIRSSTTQRWESAEGCLTNFTSRPGWIYGQNATGTGAWNDTQRQGQDGGTQWQPTSFFRGQQTSEAAAGRTNNSNEGASLRAPGKTKKPSFFTGGGQTLGSAESGNAGGSSIQSGNAGGSSSVDARAARLAAVERRSNANTKSDVRRESEV